MNKSIQNPTITKHAYERLKERNGWNRKTADRMVRKIYEEGLRIEDIKGYVRIWLKNHKNTLGAEYVMYGKHIYIFRGGILVTSFGVPKRESVRNRYFCRKEVA